MSEEKLQNNPETMEQICQVNDSTCENCRRGIRRPHPYKKWVSDTGWCRTHQCNDCTEEHNLP